MLNTEQKKILIVDDDLDVLWMLQQMLSEAGYVVDTVSGSEDACIYFEKNTCDIVLSDINMPEGSGLCLVRVLKEAGIPVISIAMSGFIDEEACREAGFAYHLQKPFSPSELTTLINHASKIH